MFKTIEKLLNLSNKLDISGDYKSSKQIDLLCKYIVRESKNNSLDISKIQKFSSSIKLSEDDKTILKEAFFGEFLSGLGDNAKDILKSPFNPILDKNKKNKLINEITMLINNLTSVINKLDLNSLEGQSIIKEKVLKMTDMVKVNFANLASTEKNKDLWKLESVVVEVIINWETEQPKYEFKDALTALRNILLKIKSGSINLIQPDTTKNKDYNYNYNIHKKIPLKRINSVDLYHKLSNEPPSIDLLDDFKSYKDLFKLMVEKVISHNSLESAIKEVEDFYLRIKQPISRETAVKKAEFLRKSYGI